MYRRSETDRLLLNALDALINDRAFAHLPGGKVIAIFARTKLRVRELYHDDAQLPPPEHFVTAVVAMARFELDEVAAAIPD
jgi:hypothetical protein